MCLTVRGRFQVGHMGRSSFFIRKTWVNLVWPILSLFMVTSSFLVNELVCHGRIWFLISFNLVLDRYFRFVLLNVENFIFNFQFNVGYWIYFVSGCICWYNGLFCEFIHSFVSGDISMAWYSNYFYNKGLKLFFVSTLVSVGS